MTIQNAAKRFNTVTVDGWDSNAQQWVDSVAVGSFQVFDRFISSRTFGQKVRVFMCGQGNEIDVSNYSLIRIKADLTLFIVVSVNRDIISDTAYSSIYMLKEANYPADIIKDLATTNAAGVAGSTVPIVALSTFCDIERVGKSDSSQVSDLTFTSVVATFPNFVDIDEDTRILSRGRYYEVREVYEELLTIKAHVVAGGVA